MKSRPACTSVVGSCKTGSVAKPFTDTLPLPYDSDNWGQSNEHWQADAAGSVGKKYLAQRQIRSPYELQGEHNSEQASLDRPGRINAANHAYTNGPYDVNGGSAGW